MDGARLAATFPYCAPDGRLLYTVLRYEWPAPAGEKPEKTFRITRPISDGWAWGLGDVSRVLYRLPELTSAPAHWVVFVVEGEKKADALRALGARATTCSEGARKWLQVSDRHDALRDRHVVTLPDNDDDGRAHAAQVAEDAQGVARSVRIVELPGLPPHGDVVEWITGGGTFPELLQLVIATPVEAPPSRAEESPQEPPADLPAQLMAANVRLNQRIELDARRVTAAPLSAGLKVALLAIRREIETHPRQQDANGMLTLYKLPETAARLNMSVATLRKRLHDGAEMRALRLGKVATPNGNHLLTVGIGPLMDAPEQWKAPENAKPHGGKRAGAGRKCPACGSKNVRLSKKTVLVIRCRNRGCGAVTEEMLGAEVVASPDGAWAEEGNIQDECWSPDDATVASSDVPNDPPPQVWIDAHFERRPPAYPRPERPCFHCDADCWRWDGERWVSGCLDHKEAS
jgi:hypothetical protein